MGLTQVINVANTGLSATEAGLEIIARNVANADTPGYTRKSQDLHSLVAEGQSMGVRIGDVTRVVNEFLQTELRGEISNLSSLNTKKQFVDRLDELFGQPGGSNALDTILNNFTDAIQQLTTSPDDFTVRQTAVADAQGMAAQLRTLSTEIQDLRQLAEDSLTQGVNEVNDVLSQIETLNTQLTDFAHQTPPPDILDERDKLLGR
ncbi:MAG: FlgK family flagellar hook-associated protein, partial [Methyloligellaceae bacterium]